jgi:hypothetical protein
MVAFIAGIRRVLESERSAQRLQVNLGGGIRATPDLKQLGALCEWFQCDNQGRGGDDTPIWGCASQGRVCNAVQSGKMATNVTGETGTLLQG